MMKEDNKCIGFKTGGITAGLKNTGAKDIGLIFSEIPANAAAIFTTNKIQASSVILNKKRLQSGKCQAIIVNSGNANCCTGDQGMQDTLSMAKATASELGIEENLVLVASTGVIGAPIPIEKIKLAVPEIVKTLNPDGYTALAESIMTTDTKKKIVSVQGQIENELYTVTGVAKGSGMIHPDMATLLCFVCTDIKAEPEILQETLLNTASKSFNRITIDGDTSTNDMVVIMANGLSGAVIKDNSHIENFQVILDDVLMQLARMIIKDGEGATKLVEISVNGALSDTDALKIAETIANSNLVKTAFFGEDANWGRIIAAAGRAGVHLEPDRIDIFFDDIQMVENSMSCGNEAEENATEVLKKKEFVIRINLNMGIGKSSVLTCDFSLDYVKINADYRS